MKSPLQRVIYRTLTQTIAATNGLSLKDTLKLIMKSDLKDSSPEAEKVFRDFDEKLSQFAIQNYSIEALLDHDVSKALLEFFRRFPVRFHEDHIHLTGSLTSDFLFARLQKLFVNSDAYRDNIERTYGTGNWPIRDASHLAELLCLGSDEGFQKYLKILYLPKLILVDRQSHAESSYHMAEALYNQFNVGHVRLKFTMARAGTGESEKVIGADSISSEDVVLGLYEGFRKFQEEHPDFGFVLSPSFRKEKDFFDTKFGTRKAHFEHQVDQILHILDSHPELENILCEVDTVGDEADHFRKEHFNEFAKGIRKLRYRGFRIRSHHGETFRTLKRGIQAVDNAMNIWQIDTLEHGLALGINPNFYFHRIYQDVLQQNARGQKIAPSSIEFAEVSEFEWGRHRAALDQILAGQKLSEAQRIGFLKAKFHASREVEQYQHDVLNRVIDKGIRLVSLPSSNNKLTGQFQDYKDHPFSWWEKKGVELGLGTDNYVTLNTNYLQEMLILLLTDANDLKIMKLLMVATREDRRPYLSHLLWKMHNQC